MDNDAGTRPVITMKRQTFIYSCTEWRASQPMDIPISQARLSSSALKNGVNELPPSSEINRNQRAHRKCRDTDTSAGRQFSWQVLKKVKSGCNFFASLAVAGFGHLIFQSGAP